MNKTDICEPIGNLNNEWIFDNNRSFISLCFIYFYLFYISILNSVAMNIGIHVSFWVVIFSGHAGRKLLRSIGISALCSVTTKRGGMGRWEGGLRGMASMYAAAKSLQSCPTLCDPMDCRLPGSSIRGIFQARVLEWGAIAFSASMYTHGWVTVLYSRN